MHAPLAPSVMTEPVDVTRAALDFVHRLLLRPASEQPDLPGLLAELTAAFQSESAGLALLPDGQPLVRHPSQAATPTSWPWHDDPSLLSRTQLPPGAVSVETAAGRFVVTSFRATDEWVLWLEDPHHAPRSDAELAALSLAGQGLARCLHKDGTRWSEQLDRRVRQQHLETAADVTRRLAHDFGNVLTGILGFTELALTQQIPASTPLHTYLHEVYRAAQAGAQFTHQLRLFSRRQSSSSRPSQLTSVLAEQEARLFAAQPTGLNFRLNVPTDLPPVGLDAETLHQVLTALLDNAREALMGPGTISVSARTVELSCGECQDLYGAALPGPYIEIIIADTGAGLSPEVQRRLFVEPFFTTKPRRRGFGLATAYGILYAHKGGLRLHAGEERGVVARVLVPTAPAAVAPPPAAEPAQAPDRARGERILVVDDEADVLQYVSATLERAGYRPFAVNSPEQALQEYFAHPTDPFRLVLTDVVMPNVNGVELARRLLRRDPGVKVVFMSGHVSSDFTQQDIVRSFELLAKPFRSEQLLRVVRTTLDRPVRRPGREGGTVGAPVLSGVSKK